MKKVIWNIYLIILLLIISCTDNSTGTVDDTDTQIALNGYVKYKDETGVENVIVKITNTNFSDTTDKSGAYSINVSKDTINKYDIDLNTLIDSIEIIENNIIIGKISVSEWVSTLPTYYFKQRDIFGDLLTNRTDIKFIQAILSRYSLTNSHTESFNLWFDKVGFRYSGFIYFNEESVDTGYSVFIKVFDSDSHFVGLSQTIHFNNSAGNIKIPDFDPFNAVPKASITCSTTVSLNDSIIVYGKAIDSFGGSIISWKWALNQDSIFCNYVGDSIIKVKTPSIVGSYDYLLKIMDNDSNVAITSQTINVIEDVPNVILFSNKDTVTINDTIILTAKASDIYGSITKIEFNTGDSNSFETYPDSSCTTIVKDFVGNFITKITDDDGMEAYDTVSLTVIEDKPTISVLNIPNYAIDGDTVKANSYAFDIFGEIIKWYWSIDTFNSFIEVQADSNDGFLSYCSYNFTVSSGKRDSLPIIVKIIDDDNNETYDTVFLRVVDSISAEGKVFIPSYYQSFLMGDTIPRNDASPIHQVKFDYNFYMDTVEVTQKMFDSIMTLTYSNYYSKPDWENEYKVGKNYPAYRVGWYDAVLYCNGLSKIYNLDTVYEYSSINGMAGRYCTLTDLTTDFSSEGVRLPTEAEWEFAARGGTTGLNYWEKLPNNEPNIYCWYWNGTNTLYTNEVGQKTPNIYGLYDIIGNVWEWVNDWKKDYSSDLQTNPTGPSTGTQKVIRGWSFYDSAPDLNCVARRGFNPSDGEFNKGFRTVRIKKGF